MPPRRRTTKPAVVETPVVEDDAFEDVDDLDELDEVTDEVSDDVEDEPTPAPKTSRNAKVTKAAPKAAASAAPKSEFDSNWLAEHVNEMCGTSYDSRAIRMLLRKLAKDGFLEREVGTDRSRYSFPKGANDPTVKAVVKAVKTGAVEAEKAEKIAAAQATKAAKAAPKPAAKAAPAGRGRRRRAASTEE